MRTFSAISRSNSRYLGGPLCKPLADRRLDLFMTPIETAVKQRGLSSERVYTRMALELRTISFKAACEYIDTYHRHHKKPCGWKFGLAAYQDNVLVGIAVVGRPVARKLDDGETIEVTRLCTNGAKNACSFLYGACARAAKALGYRRLVTYILDSEHGKSLKAAGWVATAVTQGGSWNRPSRGRVDKAPTCPKQRWEMPSG